MAVDSIYAFLNSTLNFITYQEIVQLLEAAYYRALFNYYIFRNKEKDGVLIPDYCMKYIDPRFTYHANGNLKESHINVIQVDLHTVKIDMAKDLKLISEAFTWAIHLIS
jgi:hypothetical protein